MPPHEPRKARTSARAPARSGKAAKKVTPRSATRPGQQLVHTTLRLHPDVRRRLDALGVQLGVTLNSLMNEGLAEFVAMRTAALEVDIKAALERLKAYRRADPTFARDHLLIAQDEVATRGADPVEGTPYRVRREPLARTRERGRAGRR